MDKPGKPKTVIIKINGKERPVEKRKITTWDSKKNSEQIAAIDELAKKEVAAGQEADEMSEFDWILPEVEEKEDLQEYKMAPTKKKTSKGPSGVISPKKKSPNKKGVLPSILLTVFLAVLFGSTLGVLLLKMVVTETATETGGSPVVETPSDEVENTPATASLPLQPITGYVVQGGAFSNMEAATSEASMMIEKGIPAKSMEIDGNAYLFVGLGNSLPDAKTIGTNLKNKGIETFAKEVQIGGGEKSQLKEQEKLMLEMVPPLYESLSHISSATTLSSTIPADSKQSLDEKLEKWNGLGKLDNTQLQDLKAELDGAITSIKSYEEKQEAETLNKIQQHLLNFLALYGSL